MVSCEMSFVGKGMSKVGTDVGVGVCGVAVDVGEAADDGSDWANVQVGSVMVDDSVACSSLAVV